MNTLSVHQTGVEQTPDEVALLNEIKAMTDSQLEDVLADGIRLTAAVVLRLALAWHEYRSRGNSVARFRGVIYQQLARVALRQTVPHLVVAFHNQPNTLRRLSRLIVSDQLRIALGERIPVVTGRAENEYRLMAYGEMNHIQVRLVLDEDHIRNPAEQIVYLNRHKDTPEPAKPPKRHCLLQAIPARNVLRIGREEVPPAVVIETLSDLAPAPDTGPMTNTLSLRFSDAEMRRLRQWAADRSDGDVRALVRSVLRSVGAI